MNTTLASPRYHLHINRYDHETSAATRCVLRTDSLDEARRQRDELRPTQRICDILDAHRIDDVTGDYAVVEWPDLSAGVSNGITTTRG